MTGIKRRITTLEEKLGVNQETIVIVVRRVITNNLQVAKGGIEPSESIGDKIYERTIVLNHREQIN